MSREAYVHKVMAIFEPMGDQRLQEEIDAIKLALQSNQAEYAAGTLIPRLYAKHKKIVLDDLLSAMPIEGFDRPRRLIQEGSYRAAAHEIDRLVDSGLGLWRPSEKELATMKNFWDYYCG